MIELANISKQYGKIKALDDVTLSLPKGKIIGLCGPNGSGKTTLIKILMGLITDFKGKVAINGFPIGKESKLIVSYLPDVNYLDSKATGVKTKKLFMDMYSNFDEARFDLLMSELKLDPTQSFGSMSKGMKEKFQLALVMARKADVYILDEPIGGVDPAARELVLKTILENYDPESLVLLATHLISDIEQIFDQVIFLKEGKINLYEDVEALRSQHNQSIDGLFREVFR
jgi:ABC-2 type transport system ATP-binding protein